AGVAGILAFEAPFKIQLIEGNLLLPPSGAGLNESLINYWVKIHPPTIFLGFGSLTVLFCWGLAALIHKDLDAWAKMIRPWVIVSATLLGVGLSMGGFWAYETLGWGGFWAWDPVENTSFVPWLWVITLLHGIIVQTARGNWKRFNVIVAGTSFLSFVYGTFLTRSGFLGETSVHSFAQMDRSALKILIGLFVGAILAFGYCYFRYVRSAEPETRQDNEKGPTLEKSYNIAVWFFLGMSLAAAIGMSVPVMSQIGGGKQATVPEHLYNQITIWLFVPIVLLMAIAPFVSWRGTSGKVIFDKLTYPLAASLAVVSALIFWLKIIPVDLRTPASDMTEGLWGINVRTDILVYFLAWACLFGICANFARIFQTWKRSKAGIGSFVTHIGVLTAMLGLVVSRGLERKEQFTLQGAQESPALGYMVKLAGMTADDFKTRDNKVMLKFTSAKESFTAYPTLYYVHQPGAPEEQAVPRPDIQLRGMYDIYIALGKMVFDVGDPATLKKGQTLVIPESKIEFTYKAFRREGEAGKSGTSFFADLTMLTTDGKTTSVSPGMKLTGGQPEFITADAGPYTVSLQKMDAADQSVTLEFFYKVPLFPVQVFFKPLTIFVWIGTGIMMVGGFWSAWYRRKSYLPAPEAPESDATLPTAQS
ncbi:MAG: cytochrome c biogenesis protein CcsA, partial [Armatimonadetes bacterium]|nr:cytochrome c biogenesis protein CcsA [Armatimonadota bacterium]